MWAAGCIELEKVPEAGTYPIWEIGGKPPLLEKLPPRP